MFGAQVSAIRAAYGIQPGERDLPAFPLFGLFAPALGTTCVIPEMNPSRPAQCDPAKIAKAIQAHEITYTFGSPAIWRRVGPYCIEKGITFPNVRRILIAGAPVRAEVLEPFKKILPNGDTYIPYGATEALPVATIRGSEVLSETWALTRAGKGYCVGRPLPGVTVRVIACAPAVDESGQWERAFVLPAGAIGEIVVKGPVVTREYCNMPEQTRAAKIYEAYSPRRRGDAEKGNENETDVWHRMGDMGYLDEQGRLWFCGRKAHRVILSREKILFSVCVEAIVEAFMGDVLKCGIRTALVGIGEPGSQKGVIIVEAPKHLSTRVFQKLVPDLEKWRATEPLARDIIGIALYRKPFPVDVRHNAKIDREKLGRWAAKLTNWDWTIQF
jgi:acyl-CoA synthetase (AMP-forming)/AMP-acid ligase II